MGRSFPTHLPFVQPSAQWVQRPGEGPGGNRVVKKLRVLSITAKRGSVHPPPSFPAFNLITAPHSPNRSRLQLELFTRAALSSFPSPTSPLASLEAPASGPERPSISILPGTQDPSQQPQRPRPVPVLPRAAPRREEALGMNPFYGSKN